MTDNKPTFLKGIKDGLPVFAAYLAVSFTFGILSVKNGIPAWLASLISFTNLTSAGQFAGINLIAISASFFEIFIAVFIINARYILMSLSISQQLNESTNTLKRLLMSFFVTDEIFALASMQKKNLNFNYFIGLGLMPLIGWTLGTALGALVNDILPQSIQNAMGIALYAMFIAIIIPPARSSKPLIICIATACALSIALYYIFGEKLSFGFRVIIVAVAVSALMAYIFPIKIEEKNETKEVESN